jgi:hypothetical protein
LRYAKKLDETGGAGALNFPLPLFVTLIAEIVMKPEQALLLAAIFNFVAAAAIGIAGYMGDKVAFYGVAAAFVGVGVMFLAAAKAKRPK